MAILQNLAQFGSEKNLEFMVIGGHAVISHGYSRRTLDLDILIPKGDGYIWRKYVLGLGYSLLFETDNFFQCTAPERASWPLDFMMVKPETFTKFKSEAVRVLIQGVQVSVPSIKHLIALKLHAMKSRQRSWMFRDMDDVINLIQLNKMMSNVTNSKSCAKLTRALNYMNTSSEPDHNPKPQPDDSILELPDGSDFVSKHVTLPFDQVLEACEAQLRLVNSDPEFEKKRLRDKVDVPFELL